MTTLLWSSAFTQKLKRKVRRNPELRANVEQTLRRLAQDPFDPSLKSHKLKGELSGIWACSVKYDLRILFEFVYNDETGTKEIYLLTVSGHNEVY